MPDNYAKQADLARKIFLTYDQSALEQLPTVTSDADFLYLNFLATPHRICRKTGHIFRKTGTQWTPADAHGVVLTLFDYLCDAAPGRAPAGVFVSMASLGKHVHQTLALYSGALDHKIEEDPAAFRRACLALGGTEVPGGDMSFVVPLFDDLPIQLRFWHADEEFPPKLDLLWDKNTLQFLRYETTWFAAGILRQCIGEALG